MIIETFVFPCAILANTSVPQHIHYAWSDKLTKCIELIEVWQKIQRAESNVDLGDVKSSWLVKEEANSFYEIELTSEINPTAESKTSNKANYFSRCRYVHEANNKSVTIASGDQGIVNDKPYGEKADVYSDLTLEILKGSVSRVNELGSRGQESLRGPFVLKSNNKYTIKLHSSYLKKIMCHTIILK